MKVCSKCFNDVELKSYISTNFSEVSECSYCKGGVSVELIDFNEISDFFSTFIDIFQEDTDGKPLFELIKDDWDLFSESTSSEVLLKDILQNIGASISNPHQKSNYIEEILDSVSFWGKLKKELKWEKRFITSYEEIKDLRWDYYFNNSLISLPNDLKLYRARLHQNSGQSVFGLDQMGCPEKGKSSAGRANPYGIPYLYLSADKRTTLYEIRVAYLDEVSVGTFVVKDGESLNLVDFTDIPSAFAYEVMGSIVEYTKSRLIKKMISIDLSKPLRRYDSELEYIPTQFICEFIKVITGADGIKFNSSLHKDGVNIVLFEQEKVNCLVVEKEFINDVSIKSKIIP